jgi:hypothetical protein
MGPCRMTRGPGGAQTARRGLEDSASGLRNATWSGDGIRDGETKTEMSRAL